LASVARSPVAERRAPARSCSYCGPASTFPSTIASTSPLQVHGGRFPERAARATLCIERRARTSHYDDATAKAIHRTSQSRRAPPAGQRQHDGGRTKLRTLIEMNDSKAGSRRWFDRRARGYESWVTSRWRNPVQRGHEIGRAQPLKVETRVQIPLRLLRPEAYPGGYVGQTAPHGPAAYTGASRRPAPAADSRLARPGPGCGEGTYKPFRASRGHGARALTALMVDVVVCAPLISRSGSVANARELSSSSGASGA
jgi:hypothetical protein